MNMPLSQFYAVKSLSDYSFWSRNIFNLFSQKSISPKMAAILKDNLNRPLEHMPGLSKKTWTKFNSIENFYSYFNELPYCTFTRDISQLLTPILGALGT